MTRAQTAANGLVTPPPLQRWLNAVLLLCVSLVQGIAAMFGMRKRNTERDWHTHLAPHALPQTKPDIHLKENSATVRRQLAVDAQRRIQTLTQAPVAQSLSLSFQPKPRSGAELEPRGDKLRGLHTQSLDSGSRLRASGMTTLVCPTP